MIDDLWLKTLIKNKEEQLREYEKLSNTTVLNKPEEKPKTFKPMKFNMYVPHAVTPDVKVKCKLT